MGEGVHYSSVKFKKNLRHETAAPHEDVTYSEVKTRSPTSSNTVCHCGSAENFRQSFHPYRLAAVCLGLLCALFLAATLVLCVLYTHLSQNCAMLERDQEKLRANNSAMKQENDQLQKDYTSVFTLPFVRRYCLFNSSERECKHCPLGWEQLSSKCYYFSHEEKKSWMASHRDCIKRGAYLVIVESEEEQEFVTNNIRERSYWIGLSDSETEGTWLWVDGTPLQRDFWHSNEPDNFVLHHRLHYPNADCAVTTQYDVWLDATCDLRLSFICETDALPL